MTTLSLTVAPESAGTVVIRPEGEIDADNAHQMREAISALLAERPPNTITIDMSGVTFVDSVAIGALVGCYHASVACKVRLQVVNLTAQVHRLLYVAGLLGLFGTPAHGPHEPADQVR
ncbi:MAG: STAS domain-containing protein [Micromonosporaceae bacterium]|nr:STAS domain-containing protein [Micromonosporaceae bacterium]